MRVSIWRIVGTALLLCVVGRWSAAADPVPYDQAAEGLPTPETVVSAVLDGDAFHAPEGVGRCEAGVDESGAVLRLHIGEKTTNIWEAGLSWPTAEAIPERDLLLLVFELRSLDADDPAEVRAVFRRSARPYDHALSETCRAGSSWQEIALVFPAQVNLAPGEGLLIVNLGAKAQSLEMRRVRLLNFSRTVNRGTLLGALQRSPPRSSRTVVGEHLNPELLWEMSSYADLLDVDAPFDPAGPWRHTYAIWTCHGYMHHANRNPGLLTISRQAGTEAGLTEITIERLLINDTGEVHSTDAVVRCRGDVLSTPIEWTLTHSVIPPGESTPAARLTTTEVGSVSEGIVSLRIDGEWVKRPDWVAPLTADWCLFDAVQRLGSDGSLPAGEFAILEGFGLYKQGARLLAGGVHEVVIQGRTHRLRRLDLIGYGILPYEFWLDASDRLVMVVTHSRAYILQPDARRRYEDYADGRIRRAARAAARENDAAAEEK